MLSRWHVRRGAVAVWCAWLLLIGSAGCGSDSQPPAADSASTADSADVQATDTAVGDADDDAGQSDAAIADATDAAALTDAVADAQTDANAASDASPDAATDAAGDVKPDVFVPVVPGFYPATCTTDEDCANSCVLSATCSEAGTCSFVPRVGVCLQPVAPDQVECLKTGMTSEATPCLSCQPAPGGAQLSAASWKLALDGNGEGVSITELHKTGMSWSFVSKRSVSGGSSLYFGDPQKAQYHNGKQVGAIATFPKTTIPAANANPRLQFWLWLQTEQTAGDDLLTLAVQEAAPAAVPVKVWTSDSIGGSTQGGWQRVTVDLADFAGKQVQFQALFETKDAILNAYEGAYLDDISVASGCCASQADCNDGDACTADSCTPGEGGLPVCSHQTKANCCNTLGDCDDGLACTLDLCPVPGEACAHSAKPGCCNTTADCDDNNACTIDSCPTAGGQCLHQNTCCQGDSECKSADPCQKGACVAGQCVYTDTCCSQDTDCDDFNPCTKDACDKGKCVFTAATVPGCCSPQLLQAKFAGSDDGVVSDPPVSGLSWFYKDVGNAAKSGPGVLAFGDPKSESWTVSGAVKVRATTPTISVLSGKETSFAFQVFGSSQLSTSYNLRVIAQLDDGPVVLTTIAGWSVSNTWKLFTFDFSGLGGKSFPIVFEFERTSSSGSFSGGHLYIDDVEVTSTCLPKKCAGSAQCNPSPWPFGCIAGVCNDGQCTYANSCCKDSSECNDGNLCTQDSCSNQKCSFKAIAGCCMGDGDCDDNNACTTNVCSGPGGTCTFPTIAGCCTSSSQCNDNNACTIDKCTGQKCVNQNTCCTSDAECADGETTCTIDTCVNKACAHTPTGAAGCCTPEVWVNDFDSGSLMDMTLTNSAGPTQGWQLAQAPGGQSKSGKGALYYGQTSTFDFSFGSSNGQASTPLIALPEATPSKLSLWLYMDTESGMIYDQLSIHVAAAGKKTKVFDKSTFGFSTGSWYEVKADLASFAGEEIQVIIDFNTVDGAANGGLGVVVDDLSITTDCGQ